MRFQKDERIIWHEAKNGMYLELPMYKREFMEELKEIVPHEERKWSRRRGQYWISDLYLDEVDNLLFDHFEQYGEGRDR